jgi:7,8-dihydropterin-6-yl-methyl-4-(beta-D-ribofuranosyl)aminobenzene 5'-phosphate synthase
MIISCKPIVENTTCKSHIYGQHGLSLAIAGGGARVLFDTGAGGLLVGNAAKLGVELKDYPAVVISHGHHDHGGGLAEALTANPGLNLFIHPGALDGHYNHSEAAGFSGIGLPPDAIAAAERIRLAGNLRLVASPRAVAGPFTAFPAGPRPEIPADWHFFVKAADGSFIHDDFSHEISLLFEGDQKSVLFVGCAHPTMPAVVANAIRLGRKPLGAIVGGTHLGVAPDSEIEWLAEYCRENGIEAHVGHCTGIVGFAKLFRLIPDLARPLAIGQELILDI